MKTVAIGLRLLAVAVLSVNMTSLIAMAPQVAVAQQAPVDRLAGVKTLAGKVVGSMKWAEALPGRACVKTVNGISSGLQRVCPSLTKVHLAVVASALAMSPKVMESVMDCATALRASFGVDGVKACCAESLELGIYMVNFIPNNATTLTNVILETLPYELKALVGAAGAWYIAKYLVKVAWAHIPALKVVKKDSKNTAQ